MSSSLADPPAQRSPGARSVPTQSDAHRPPRTRTCGGASSCGGGAGWHLDSQFLSVPDNSEQTLMQCELYVVQRQTHLIYRV